MQTKRFIHFSTTKALVLLCGVIILWCTHSAFAQTPTIEHPVVRLRALDKITARTVTFDATVGKTIKFGDMYVKPQTCRKTSPVESPESAAFLQIWEVSVSNKAEWIFSGWMFASSPGLSSMDHTIYDVWVIDCLQEPDQLTPSMDSSDEKRQGEGEVEDEADIVIPDDDAQ